MRSLRFNQGFALNRSEIGGMLQFSKTDTPPSDSALGEYLGLNPYKISGLRGWFCKLGLGTSSASNTYLSPFGLLIREFDPMMELAETQWLLHYHLATEHEEKSDAWFYGWNHFIQPNISFTKSDLEFYIEKQLVEVSNKDAIKKDTAEFLKTYKDVKALGRLNLIQANKDKTFVASLSKPPHYLIAAFMLFNTWQQRYPLTDTLSLTQLATEPETLGRILIATHAQTKSIILDLQAKGLVNFSDTQHEPVTRRYFEEPIELLQQFYQSL